MLTILTIFTISNNLDNFWQFSTILTIFDNFDKFWQFWRFLQFFRHLHCALWWHHAAAGKKRKHLKYYEALHRHLRRQHPALDRLQRHHGQEAEKAKRASNQQVCSIQGPPWLPSSRNLADVQEFGGFPRNHCTMCTLFSI